MRVFFSPCTKEKKKKTTPYLRAHSVSGTAAGTDKPISVHTLAARLTFRPSAVIIRVVFARRGGQLMNPSVIIKPAVRCDFPPWCEIPQHSTSSSIITWKYNLSIRTFFKRARYTCGTAALPAGRRIVALLRVSHPHHSSAHWSPTLQDVDLGRAPPLLHETFYSSKDAKVSLLRPTTKHICHTWRCSSL